MHWRCSAATKRPEGAQSVVAGLPDLLYFLVDASPKNNLWRTALKTNDELVQEENRRIRLLRISTDLLVHCFMTRPLTLAEADKLIRGMRSFASKLFPGKEHVFDLVYLPRFRRALMEAGAQKLPGSLENLGT